MMVFDELDGIGRLQAFLISAGINAIFLALLYLLPHQQPAQNGNRPAIP
jgi:hypothetical protein